MMTKFLVIVICGLMHCSVASRYKFERSYEPMFRGEQLYKTNPGGYGELIYKREPLLQRDAIIQDNQMIGQSNVMRSEGIYPQERIYGNEALSQSQMMTSNDQFLQSEPMIQNEAMMRSGESILRSEPVFRRERLFKSAAAIPRDGPIFVLTPCPCSPERENLGSMQEAIIQLQQQPSQPQQIFTQRLICPKPIIKSGMFQPLVAIPRLSRFTRKSFRTIPETIQLSSLPLSTQQEFNSFNNNPSLRLSTNFSAQPTSNNSENTPEPSNNTPATVRTVSQLPNAVPNPLALAQMSSIC